MFKNILFIMTVLFGISPAFAQQDVWHILEYDDTDAVVLGVNGQITQGDMLYITLPKGECDMGILTTTVASFRDYDITKTLTDTWIPVTFMGHDIEVRVVRSDPYFIGSLTTIHIRALPTPTLHDALIVSDTITIQYKDGDTFKITDFFDLPQNRWSTQGLTQAFNTGTEKCLKL